MKATFALLADIETANLVRNLSWDIHQKYRTGIDICRLTPHVSLKQPFDISTLTPLTSFMADFAKSIHPFEVTLTRLQLIETTMDELITGILWLDVRETDQLRQLHNRLNEELTVRIGNVPAAFDGSAYHFHMSVAIGGQPIDVYRQIFQEFSSQWVTHQYIARELAMFVYDERFSDNGGYMTYKVLPCGQ